MSKIICRHKTHEKYQADSKILLDAAKADKFKDTLKWEHWKPTFLMYIRSFPGRDGIQIEVRLS